MKSNAFFYYANERENTRVRREKGDDPPFSEDPILQQYRFTNVFREDDKVTRWVRTHDYCTVWPETEEMWQYQVFYTIMARWFNRLETLSHCYRVELFRDFFFNGPQATLDSIRAWRPKGPWVTGAYIIHTPNGMNWDKLQGVCEDIELVRQDLDALFMRWMKQETLTMEWMTNDLCRYRDLGPFMAYEIVCDLRWSLLRNDVPQDVSTWANPGPGARRGLWRIYGQEKFLANSKAGTRLCIEAMRLLLHEWREGIGPRPREAEMREVEHTLCEFDKYERARLGEGRPREKFRVPD